MSKKKNKPFRPKARRPRGFEDRSSDVLRAEARLIQAAFSVYDMHGFEPLQTPAFEFADADNMRSASITANYSTVFWKAPACPIQTQAPYSA